MLFSLAMVGEDFILNNNLKNEPHIKNTILHLRTDRRASGNSGFKEMAGDVLNQKVVLLIKYSGRLTVSTSKSATS